MVKFNTAIKWMKEGKKVRRPNWKEDSYLVLGIHKVISFKGIRNAHIHLDQIEAGDWEIYKEKKETESKTLKDLVKEGIVRKGDAYVLKQDAIKDIKHFRKNRSSNLDYSKQELDGIEKYTMWKFNIKEEDLK